MSTEAGGLRVSIAMATYNGAAYIVDQLRSICAQRRLPDELVVFDDGSSDGTEDLILPSTRGAGFEVKIYRNDRNVGYAENFTRAIRGCSGDVIFLADQDDYWLPNKISSVLECFAADSRAQVVIHDLEFCNESLVPIGQRKIERIEQFSSIERNYCTGMATAIRRDFALACLPLPAVKGISHDSWIHDCAWAIGAKRILREVLALYRRHENNATVLSPLNVPVVLRPKGMDFGRVIRRIREPTVLTDPRNWPISQWLGANRDFVVSRNWALDAQLEKRMSEFDDEVSGFIERSRILELNRGPRLLSVLQFWLRGGYRRYSGIRSAVKDLISN